MKKIFQQYTVFLSLVSYLFVALLLPFSEAIAQTKSFEQADWIEHCVDTSCVTKISAPRINWSEIARAPSADRVSVLDTKNIQGDGWVTRAHEAAGMLGLSSDQISNAVFRGAGQRPIVIARYLAEKTWHGFRFTKSNIDPMG